MLYSCHNSEHFFAWQFSGKAVHSCAAARRRVRVREQLRKSCEKLRRSRIYISSAYQVWCYHSRYCVWVLMTCYASCRELREVTGLELFLKIGIHSGSVASGVVGSVRWSHDTFSRDVRVAIEVMQACAPWWVEIRSPTSTFEFFRHSLSSFTNCLNFQQGSCFTLNIRQTWRRLWRRHDVIVVGITTKHWHVLRQRKTPTTSTCLTSYQCLP